MMSMPKVPTIGATIEFFLVHDHRDFTVSRKGYDPREIAENGGKKEGFFVFPVEAYIHSGVVLSVGSGGRGWDVSHCGFILVSKEETTDETEALKMAEGLCEAWNEYLSGEVYEFTTSTGDSCGGFYGSAGLEEAEAEGRADIDYILNKRLQKALARKKVEIKHRVPLGKREAVPMV